MSQVSYGTITIVDTNDIESITIEYAQNQDSSNPPSSGWDTVRPTWRQNYFIWQRTRIHKSGTTADKDSFGAAVCLTGSTGATGSTGQSLSTTKTQYTHVASNVTITTSNHTSYTWTDNVPEYDSTKPVYWGRITNTYMNPAKTEYIIYKDNGLTEAIANSVEANTNASDALDKANESNSIAIHANENAQGALSISRATQQHFWFNSTTSGSIEAGAYITDTPIDTFKSGKNGGYLLARSDGVELGRGTNKFMTLSATALNFYRPGTNTIDATLTSKGLILTKGGLKVGTYNASAADVNQNFVYLSSEDYGTAIKIGDSSSDKKDWRQIIGNKFGVDRAGNLYAAGAHIDGDIIAQSLTIGSGANAYDGMAAINISSYSIEIVIENIEEDDDHVYLYPHLYHNGIEERVSDYTRFLWYENNNEIAIIGDGTNYGRILASRSNSYRVTYEFDDGEVGSGTPIETIKVEPTEYITNIDNIGIKVHPKQWSINSNYLQIDGNGVYIKDSNDIGLAEFTAANAQIGKSGTTHFVINADSLQAFNELGNKYFEVTANGLTWGSNAAATTTQVDNAALTASNYITDLTNGGIRIHPINNENNSVIIDSNRMEIFKGGTDVAHSVAKYGDTSRIGRQDVSHIEMDYHSFQQKDLEGRSYVYFSDLRNEQGEATINLKYTHSSYYQKYNLGYTNMGVLTFYQGNQNPVEWNYRFIGSHIIGSNVSCYVRLIVKGGAYYTYAVGDVLTVDYIYDGVTSTFTQTFDETSAGKNTSIKFFEYTDSEGLWRVDEYLDNIVSVKINGESAFGYTSSKTNGTLSVWGTDYLPLNEEFTISFDCPESENPKAYTLGIRNDDSQIGPLSTALGINNTAAGANSLVGGENNIVQGRNSFAFGDHLTTNNKRQVAFGAYNDISTIAKPMAAVQEPLFMIGGGSSSNPENFFVITDRGGIMIRNSWSTYGENALKLIDVETVGGLSGNWGIVDKKGKYADLKRFIEVLAIDHAIISQKITGVNISTLGSAGPGWYYQGVPASVYKGIESNAIISMEFAQQISGRIAFFYKNGSQWWVASNTNTGFSNISIIIRHVTRANIIPFVPSED